MTSNNFFKCASLFLAYFLSTLVSNNQARLAIIIAMTYYIDLLWYHKTASTMPIITVVIYVQTATTFIS